MKKQLLVLASIALLSGSVMAQSFTPVDVTGFNVDAVAENTPCSSYTSAPIDGSDNAMYTVTYGTNYGTGTGLPDNGTITNGIHNFQMQPFDQNNILYIPHSLTDSLVLVTPAPFSSISLLAFNTEGTGNVVFTLEFTDGTNYQYTTSLHDWFSGPNPMIGGFDRVSLASCTPDFNTSNPDMYAVDIPLPCADQIKLLKTIVVFNNSTNPRTCVAAVSGIGGLALDSTARNPSCFGGNDGSATVTTTGGNGPFTYTWSTSPAQTLDSATGLGAGTYTVTVHDVANCQFTLSYTLTSSGALSPAIIPSSNPICSGTSVTLRTGSAHSYSWSTGNTTDSVITVSPITTTTYNVTISNTTGCSGIGTQVITVYTSPTIGYAAAPSAALCGGGTVTLTGSGGTSYVWSGGVTNGTAFTPSTSTTYTVTGTDANNCSSTASVYVSVNPAPLIETVVFPSNTVCQGSDIQLSGLRAVHYQWSDNVHDDTAFSATSSHTYTVTGTDANGCTGTASVFVNVNPNPTLTVSASPSDTVCYGSDVTLNASGASSYAWSGGATNGVALPQQSISTYTVTGTDANGCYSTAAIAINVKICETTGINEIGTFTTNVYPNPNNGSFSISVNTYLTKMGIEIFDVRGRKVYDDSALNVQAGEVKQINLGNASAGLYFLRLSDGTESHVTKITVE